MKCWDPSAHVDHFTRDNLPDEADWPDCCLEGFDYPDALNVGVELTDEMVEKGFGDHTALIGNGRRRTYKELTDWTNKLAAALVEDLGVKPGNRVLIRSANNPAMVACWLAATKAGAVVVNTMPMLRAGELRAIVDKAEISHALCDTRLMDEMTACAKTSKFLKTVVGFDGTSNHEAELDRLALEKPVQFDAVDTGQDDVALLGFTIGHHGKPQGDDAFPPRSADHRGWLCARGAGRHARRCLCRITAFGVYLRPGRVGDFSTAFWRCGDACWRLQARPI